ncbi:MAG: PorV/PorQ family protein [Candidatus Cloacimonetes bacterium]|nr:PorV/PorQ family protein [Candidatus Cloacimonadota bacterium]
MTRSTRLLTYSIVLAAMVLPAALGAVSNTSVIFLLIEPGSRPGGMAEAHVAQVDDAFAGFWNPGAMAFNRKTQVAWMHTNWLGDVEGLDDMYYEYLGWNEYFQDIGNLGMHIIFFTAGKMLKTGEQGEDLGSFSSYELAAAVSWAAQVRENLGLGVTFKYILSDLAPSGTGSTEIEQKGRGMSWAFDFGVKSRGVDFGQIAVSPYNGCLAVYNGIAYLSGMEPACRSVASISA